MFTRVTAGLTAVVGAALMLASPGGARAAAFASCGAVAQVAPGARVGTNTPLRGTHQYVIQNNGNQPIFVTVTATLEDSEGGRTRETKTVYVAPGATFRETITSFYQHAFRRPGGVTLTATTVLSGGASASYSSNSSFYVGP
jgi:hypothetical protein